MKKVLLYSLIATMVVSFSPAVSAEETSQVTIPEITEAGVFVNPDESL